MIEFRGVTKSFGDNKVLDDISFEVKAGEIFFVIGKSGMGKSVLLKNIVGLLRPDSGEIYVDGKEVTQLSEEDYLSVRRNCGIVFQHPALLDGLSLYENIAFGIRAHRLCRRETEVLERVEDAMRRVRLKTDLLRRYPQELSFGMQKRASIARALVLRPNHLLFDEPTTAQDPVITSSLNRLIYDLSKSMGMTSIVVSHDMHCALEIADRILMLDQGKALAIGTPNEMEKSSVPLVRDFMMEAREHRAVLEEVY